MTESQINDVFAQFVRGCPFYIPPDRREDIAQEAWGILLGREYDYENWNGRREFALLLKLWSVARKRVLIGAGSRNCDHNLQSLSVAVANAESACKDSAPQSSSTARDILTTLHRNSIIRRVDRARMAARTILDEHRSIDGNKCEPSEIAAEADVTTDEVIEQLDKSRKSPRNFNRTVHASRQRYKFVARKIRLTTYTGCITLLLAHVLAAIPGSVVRFHPVNAARPLTITPGEEPVRFADHVQMRCTKPKEHGLLEIADHVQMGAHEVSGCGPLQLANGIQPQSIEQMMLTA